MRWYSFLVALLKRIKSDLPLLITGSLLFYYLFKNELDMLNSYAENELMPHITNDIDSTLSNDDPALRQKTGSKNALKAADFEPVVIVDGDANSHDKPKDAHAVNLFDYDTLLEKSRFFPILQDSLDTNDVFNRLSITPSDTITGVKTLSRKLKHLLVDKFTWKTIYEHLREDYPSIQAVKFKDNGFEVDAQLIKIKSLFQETFALYSKIPSMAVDEVRPLSKTRVDNGNGFGRTLIGSIDMLYLLNMEQELEYLLKRLTTEQTLLTKKNLLNTNENFITIISSLISGYELSNEKDEILLKLAKQVSKVAIKAYDTPVNGLPLAEFPFKSLIQNRFALRRSSIFDITGNMLELIKMSSLTKENVYISTGLNIFQKMKDSSRNIFNIDYLFPSIVDSSGCQLVKETKNSNKKNSKSEAYLKSIFNGKYVNCLQRETLFSVSDNGNFDSNDSQNSEFIDLINDDGNVNYLFSILKSYHLLNGHDELNFKLYFQESFEIINKYMLYRPNLPVGLLTEDEQNTFVFFSPINLKKNKDADEILINQSLKFRSQHCQLGGMFLFASRLFKNKTYEVVGEQLLNGCILLPKLTNLEVIPESVSFDKCSNLDSCNSFNSDAKIRALSDKSILTDIFEVNSQPFFSSVLIETQNKKLKITDEIIDSAKDISQLVNNDEPLIKLPTKRSSQILPDENDSDESTAKDDYKPLDSSLVTDTSKENENTNKVYKVTTSKLELENKPFDAQGKKWQDANYPFYINALDSKYMMRPEFAESLFYAYRITGNNRYRLVAAEALEKMIAHVKHTHKKHIEISAIEDLYTLTARDEMPYFWFTRTLKYYYLIFSDVSKYSLDDYILNGDGHIFKKNYLM